MRTVSITVPLTERTYQAYMTDLEETISKVQTEDEKFNLMSRKKRVVALWEKRIKVVDKKTKLK